MSNYSDQKEASDNDREVEGGALSDDLSEATDETGDEKGYCWTSIQGLAQSVQASNIG